MNFVFVNECAVDGCYKKSIGKGYQMCKQQKKEKRGKNVQRDRNDKLFDLTSDGRSMGKIVYRIQASVCASSIGPEPDERSIRRFVQI